MHRAAKHNLDSGNKREDLLTVSEAALLKEVTARSLYKAIAEQRLPAVQRLGKLGLRREDVLAYEPITYRNRNGAKPRGGRPIGSRQSDESRARISASQATRWAQLKGDNESN